MCVGDRRSGVLAPKLPELPLPGEQPQRVGDLSRAR